MTQIEFHANFEKAFSKLKSFHDQGVKDEMDEAGLIQAFEFTFEQAWKAIQKRATAEGVAINSPKQALSWAMGQGWLAPQEEKDWLSMLEDRNLTSHTYREETAKRIVEAIQKHYVALLGKLLSQIKS